MLFTDDDIKRIKDASANHLVDVVQDFQNLRKSGTSYVCDCPVCKASKKFSINPAKDIYSCFSCHQIAGAGALDYLMRVEKKEFPDALEYLAHKFSILLDQRPEDKKKPVVKMKKGSKKAKGNDTDSFCAKMLSESGLTFEDVTAKVYKIGDTSSVFELRTFRPGTINENGVIDPKGDDVIIEYYDLEGMPVTYARKDHRKKETGERKEYFRVRWQFPDAHLDKENLISTNHHQEAAPQSIFQKNYDVYIKRNSRYIGFIFRKARRKQKKLVSTGFRLLQLVVYRISD